MNNLIFSLPFLSDEVSTKADHGRLITIHDSRATSHDIFYLSLLDHNYTFVYDMLSQLVDASISNIDGGNWTADYTYKANGDMFARTINDVTENFGYNGNRMTSADSNSLEWDNNGRLTSDESRATSYEYNWDNKLRSATKGGTTIDVKYDPLGNRIWKNSTTSGTRRYIVDIVGNLPTILLELDESDTVKNKYIYANSQILATHDPSDTLYFYMHDRLGSVRQIINTSGSVVKYYTYQPFGQTIESGGSLYNPFLFTGQWYDGEIDQYFLRARQYDPILGRFTSRDPVKGRFIVPMTLHMYLYCINNPINLLDPSGAYWDGPWWLQWEFYAEMGKELLKGAAATADGWNPIPFWNPFEEYYANPDGSIDSRYAWSRIAGSVSRTALLFAINSSFVEKILKTQQVTATFGEKLLISQFWMSALISDAVSQGTAFTWGIATSSLNIMSYMNTYFDIKDALGK